MAVFLEEQRVAAPDSWSVTASAHAARWAHGKGDVPGRSARLDARESRAIAQQYGRIPAGHAGAPEGTYGGTLWRAVRDDGAFERLFASLFGAALYGVERSQRRRALSQLPSVFSALVLREFEILRSRRERPVVEPTRLFEMDCAGEFRSAIGTVVASTLGALYADELATLCGGWQGWPVLPAATPAPVPLLRAWLSLFEARNE